MTPMVSRWPVLLTVAVALDEVDMDGLLTTPAVDRVLGVARAAYLDQCETLAPANLEVHTTEISRRAPVGADRMVTVSINVVEVFPERFTMMARMRPTDSDGIAADVWCSVSPAGGVTDAVRDELIALAHGATHLH